eukprot:CAMPEP_0182490026 /NCGR_PEP_ID=MMETSP1321-20130603/11_1 /TAXON_ID=91990 /ORGANISM="Bolidomonas sp., Strain RCC1657" /LENGTH=1839 /DNA_ID=CAMNT_0024692153 /DNA_START=12 /DNA_END=5531 /DNA_ORIENTATION=-
MALSPAVVAMVGIVLLALMFGLGATMRDSDIVAVSRRPKGVFVGLGSQFIWMPFIAYMSCKVCGWDDGTSQDKLYAITLILQGCTPGGSTSNLYAYFSKGDLPLSVFMTVCSTLVAFGAMPALMIFYSGLLGFGDVSSFNLGELIKGLVLVLIPVFGGVMLRTYGNPATADRAVSIGGALGFAFIFIIMAYYLADPDNREVLLATEAEVFIACIALGVVGAILGYTTARFVAKEQPRQCRTIAFETGIQNGPLSIGIANVAFLFETTSYYIYEECKTLCEEGTKFGCTGSKYDSSDYGYGSCTNDVNGELAFMNNDANTDLTAFLGQGCDAITAIEAAATVNGTNDKPLLEKAAQICVRLYCWNGHRPETLNYNPEGLGDSAYEAAYNVTLESVTTPSLFAKIGGATPPDWETFSMPNGVDGFYCPDYRATVIPLMYSFFICFTSPIMMLFFLFVLGARKEDSLWQEIPEHRWLWQVDFTKSLDLTLIDRVSMLTEKYKHCRAVGCKLSGTVIGKWTYHSYAEYLREANAISRFLIDFGLDQAAPVCILSYNRKEWFFADVGTIFAGGIPAGIYPTDTPKQIEYILNHSESQFVVVENQKQLEKIRNIRNKLLHLKEVIVMENKEDVALEDKGLIRKNAAQQANDNAAADEDGEPQDGDEGGSAIEEESDWAMEFENHVHYWSDIRELYYTDNEDTASADAKFGSVVGSLVRTVTCKKLKPKFKCPTKTDEELEMLDFEALKRRSEVKPEDVLCMIYTSGTTGPPKAVMITHRNLGWCIFSIGDIMHISPEDTMISYLPLCHIAEKTCALYGPLTFGMNVYFAAPDALRGTLIISLRQIGPTVFFGVPRIWEKISERMIAQKGKQPVLFLWCIPTGEWGKRKWSDLVTWARVLGLKGSYAKQQNLPMPKNWWYANELVFQNVKVALGLQRCRICISAAAPLSIVTAEFFMALNIIIYEAFGMSETAGAITFNTPFKDGWRTNSCGKPIAGVELKVADDGELLIRGACTCRGYYKNPEETVNLIDEEKWIHSGDIGTLDADGFVYITDRKKHIIITAGGENIAPAPLEAMLSAIEGIGHAVVVGDMQKFLTCILTIESADAAHLAYKKYGWTGDKQDFKSATKWLRDESKCKFKESVQAAIDKMNEDLPRVSTIKKFYLLEKDFSDQGNMCELTPTLKIKHRVVKQKYYKIIKKIYGKDYKETQAKAQGGAAMAQSLKINTGMWPGNRTILALLFVTKDGKVCIDDGTGCLPSVVLPDQSQFNIPNSENIRFVWCQQFCKNLKHPPEFNADRTNEDMNLYGMMITNALASLKSIISDEDAGCFYPKLLSDFYKSDLKSAVMGCVRVIENEEEVQIKGGNFRWIDTKAKPEYMPLAKLAKIHEINNKMKEKGVYIAYQCTASTRSGLFMLTPQNDFSNIPCEKMQDEVMDESTLEFLRMIRPSVKKGIKVKDIEHPAAEKFTDCLAKLKFKLGFDDDDENYTDEKMIEQLYDFDAVTLDREHSVQFIVIMHPTTLSNLNLPADLKKKHQLLPMAVYEPNHFYEFHPDVYGEMQVSVLSRNREASEMNWRVQHGKGKKGERQRHKDEKEAIRKEARRWDCMKWHMKMVHWQSTEKSAAYTDILNDEAVEKMSPKEQVDEVKANWHDEYGEWEKEAVTICSEADGWNHLQMEMEKNKFTAKFRMKSGQGVASSRMSSSTGGSNFKSAGGWSNSKVSSMSSMSNFKSSTMSSSMSSTASRSSFGQSSVSSASSVESSVEDLDDDGKPKEEQPRRKSMSIREQKKEMERSAREKRISVLKSETSSLKRTENTAATQMSVNESVGLMANETEKYTSDGRLLGADKD